MNTLMIRHPASLCNALENFDHSRWFDHWERDWPSVDIQEKNDHYILEAELPGVEEKDIEITVEDDQLIIKGGGSHERTEEEKSNYLIRERRATKFERAFRLSDKVDQERVEATFKNGVLSVVAHKKPHTTPSQIKIKSS